MAIDGFQITVEALALRFGMEPTTSVDDAEVQDFVYLRGIALSEFVGDMIMRGEVQWYQDIDDKWQLGLMTDLTKDGEI
jgi:hypothetical protein